MAPKTQRSKLAQPISDSIERPLSKIDKSLDRVADLQEELSQKFAFTEKCSYGDEQKGQNNNPLESELPQNTDRTKKEILESLAKIFDELSDADAQIIEGIVSLLCPVSLPKEAPSLYKERIDKTETPPQFIERVYKPWIGKGLSKADIRRLDRTLYNELTKWIANNGALTSLYLPSQAEINDEKLRAIGVFGKNDLRAREVIHEIGSLKKALRNRNMHLSND